LSATNPTSSPEEPRPPLFQDPLEYEVPESYDVDFIKATGQIYAIQKLEEDIEKLKMQQKEMNDFYDNRVRSVENNIERLRGFLLGYLKFKGEKHLVTHLGTVFVMEREKVEWGDPEELMKFIEANNIPAVRKGKDSVDKAALKEWCEKNGVYPTTMTRTPATSLIIKKP
jgi:hypothetical protein